MPKGPSRAGCALAPRVPARAAASPPRRDARRRTTAPSGPYGRDLPREPQAPPTAMILNRRTDRPRPRQAYIGRPSKWGNPFRLTVGVNRIRVIALYRADLVHRLRIGRVTRAELAELNGRPLVCWCAPLACHGHVLLAASAWAATEPDVGLEAARWTREPIERLVRRTTRPGARAA